MVAGMRRAAAALPRPEGGPEFDRAIMTTDRFAKMCALEVALPEGRGADWGCCAKGAGMISPAMATMLCVVTTDAGPSDRRMRALLASAVERSFNRSHCRRAR